MYIYGYTYILFGCNTTGACMRQDIGESMRRLWSRDLQNIVTTIRGKKFEYGEKNIKQINWRTYDMAQINELVDMLELIRLSVDIAVERTTATTYHTARFPGKPKRIPDGSVTKLLLLQAYFGASNRMSSGLLKVFDTKLGITENFSYKAIERGYDPMPVGYLLDQVFFITNEWGNFSEDTFGIDGTGDTVTMKVNYESKRSDQRKVKKSVNAKQEITTAWPKTERKSDFQYSVLSCGIHTKVIAGFSTTGNRHIGELSHAPDVIRQTHRNAPNFKVLLGDTLYAKRTVCRITASYNVALYSIPQSNATIKAKGVIEWSRMVYELILDPQGFLSVFHGRSISESVNSMMKRREPIPLRKRLPERKDTEEYLKILVHNLRQCCYMTYLDPERVKITLGSG